MTNPTPEMPGTSPEISPEGAASQAPTIGYEQAREELAEVVRKLESGGVPLADSMALWERGEKLAAICQQWLDGAKAKIDAARAQSAQ
ncbi:exodeoxyribonuclease VII small subunit [Luteococcus japonicus]|uniref:Exodeoxyribonuclease 7 small subunit n=3 Tax=Propionibacteriaceae TaxID=31957 RepID=A0A1R4KEB1_9ACTN|nr:exodeoxyribonuclease VII small subunit [Luteococcus japonicus]SJN42637.1 Exodeoxyribonuclease VII small subunit [Luteococcus japonicus LSP_Lj1]